MLYDALSIPQLYEEPNGTQITPPEPDGIILSSVYTECKNLSATLGKKSEIWFFP